MQWYGQGGYFGRLFGGALGGAAGTALGSALSGATEGSAEPLKPLLQAVGGKLGGDWGDKAGDWLYDKGNAHKVCCEVLSVVVQYLVHRPLGKDSMALRQTILCLVLELTLLYRSLVLMKLTL